MDSNVERLPYLAWQMKKNTPGTRKKRVSDKELFSFAQEPDWKEKLYPDILSRVSSLLNDYSACLARIRYFRSSENKSRRKSDVERILYSRAQEDEYDTDELYARFRPLPAQRVQELFQRLRQEQWHLMNESQREQFLTDTLPEFSDLHDLLSDFRFSGFRILGDILSDIIDENERPQKLAHDNISDEYREMMMTYLNRASGDSYRDAVSKKCREYLEQLLPSLAAVRYVVALGHRDWLWDLLPDAVEKNLVEVRHAE